MIEPNGDVRGKGQPPAGPGSWKSRRYSLDRKEIYAQVFHVVWPSDEELVGYARKRHGFGGDDGYYGLTYPWDLDDYQIEVDGAFIEKGHVEIRYWNGDFATLQVPEIEYLNELLTYLKMKGQTVLADAVQGQIDAGLDENKQREWYIPP